MDQAHNDQVKISLLKSYFLNPETQESDSKRRRRLGLVYEEDEQYIIFTEDLPRMMASSEEFEQIAGARESTVDVLKAQFLTSFALQFVLSGALSMLWNIFNTL